MRKFLELNSCFVEGTFGSKVEVDIRAISIHKIFGFAKTKDGFTEIIIQWEEKNLFTKNSIKTLIARIESE